MTREDHVVALGGGVVGDLAGFCAHIYQRGVPVVQVPTTLVAQVDSAYGGKTGVDLPEGKNYAGAYHLPAAVLADTATLATPAAGGAGGRLRRGAEDRAARRRRALGAGARDRGARPRRARRRRLRLRPLQVRGRRRRRARRAACATSSTSATRSATRSRRRAATRATATARRSGSACWRRCGSPTRRSCATRSRRSSRRHGLPVALDPAIDVDAILEALAARQEADRRRASASSCSPSRASPATGQMVDPAKVRAAVEELLPMTTAHNRVAVLHGVNFDVLERRDPAIYGGLSLSELEQRDRRLGARAGPGTDLLPDQLRGRVRRVPAPAARPGRRGDRQRRRLDPLQPGDRRRARRRRPAGGRGPPLRRRVPRGLAQGLGLRRAGAGEDLRQGPRRLPRGARAARPRARRRRADARPRRPPRGAAGRARARPDAGHRPRQRPLPDRLRRHQRRLRLRARRRASSSPTSATPSAPRPRSRAGRWSRSRDDWLGGIAERLDGPGRLRGRPDRRCALLEKLKEKLADGVELVAAGGAVEELRRVKDDGRAGGDRRGRRSWPTRSGAGASSAASPAAPSARSPAPPKRGSASSAREPSFPAIVAAGPNGALPHAEPGEREIGARRAGRLRHGRQARRLLLRRHPHLRHRRAGRGGARGLRARARGAAGGARGDRGRASRARRSTASPAR